MSELVPVRLTLGPRELVGMFLLGAGLYAFGRAMGAREWGLAFRAGYDNGWIDGVASRGAEGDADGKAPSEEA